MPELRSSFRLELPGRRPLLLGRRTLVMGIVNVTPDSFAGSHNSTEKAVAHGLQLASDGADILDVGGESTRPGAIPVPAAEEKDRVIPVIRSLARRSPVPVSVDTSKPEVADAALEAGASLLNDVSMLRAGDGMARLAAEHRAPLILMHSRATPATMAGETSYPDGVVQGVQDELRQALSMAREAGVAEELLLVDPGIGFAKTADQSLNLLARLQALLALGRPLVVGVSRKSFIGHVLDRPVEERTEGTLAAETVAVLGGAHIVRTHDVAASRLAVDLVDAVQASGGER